MLSCGIQGCGRPLCARGWCSMHLQRWYRHRDLHHMRPHKTFWDLVQKGASKECWIWIGNRRGVKGREYGCIWMDGRNQSAHRMSFRLSGREIPSGLSVLHRCDVPLCVNPAHLFLGTHLENMRDKVQKKRDNGSKTHCKRGHPRTDENIWIAPKSGLKHCRTCHRDSERERQRRLRRVVPS